MTSGRYGFDEKLIEQMAKGDRSAFARIYEATKSSVYGFALSLVRNREDAEDVMHDAYLRFYKGAASYQARGTPMAYLLTIVRHTALNKIRDRGAEEAVADIGAASGHQRDDDTAKRVEDRILLETSLNVLNETERQIVILHAVTGMKHREIAEILQIKISTVLSKYRRALEKMKNELGRKGVTL